MDEARIPVIVGTGQVNDRAADGASGMDPVGLMQVALRRADEDAGGGWLGRAASLTTVAQISFPELDRIPQRVAAALGFAPAQATSTAYPGGDSPVRLIDGAANRIVRGEIEVALIAGGEALRTAGLRAMEGGAQGAADPLRDAILRRAPGPGHRYGLVTPAETYPLYENATRAAWGQTLAEAQAETGQIWSLFSQVAAANPHAWIRIPRTSGDIVRPSPANRPLAFPYTKLMVANAAVNQGAALIVTSLAAARSAGVPERRLVYVHPGAAASETAEVLERDRYDHSASMAASLTGALERAGLGVHDLDAIELYSCFPCVPKMARRAIGWPADRPATVAGGLTFAGGPIGNYMTHAAAMMTGRLREGGTHGLLFANGGFMTSNHSMVLSRMPPKPDAFGLETSVQPSANARRSSAPRLLESYSGPGAIETYTVLYDRAGTPTLGIIVARAPDGHRFLANVPAGDRSTLAFLTDGGAEPVGTNFTAASGPDSRSLWAS